MIFISVVKRLQYLAGLINEEEDDFGSIDNPLDRPAKRIDRYSGLIKSLNQNKSKVYNHQSQFTFSILYDDYAFTYRYENVLEVTRGFAVIKFLVYINDKRDKDIICYSLELKYGSRAKTILNECEPVDKRSNTSLRLAIEDKSVDYYNRFKTALLNNNSYVLKVVEDLNIDLDSLKNAIKQ